MINVNATHDPKRKSWVESANDGKTDFPIQNLPFGVFRPQGAEEEPRVGVAIGDKIVDLGACREAGLFKGKAFTAALACEVAALNSLMALGMEYWSLLRQRLIELLDADAPERKHNENVVRRALVPMASAELLMPARDQCG
jgi:fumarylacetoacetase